MAPADQTRTFLEPFQKQIAKRSARATPHGQASTAPCNPRPTPSLWRCGAGRRGDAGRRHAQGGCCYGLGEPPAHSNWQSCLECCWIPRGRPIDGCDCHRKQKEKTPCMGKVIRTTPRVSQSRCDRGATDTAVPARLALLQTIHSFQ